MKRLLCLLLLLTASNLFAANKYVRQGAAGTGSGLDWTNAHTALPATLTRGDTYYVADGTYGGYTFNTSGTTLTTIKKATVADHGTSTGWSDAFGDGEALFQAAGTVWGFTTGNYTIDGMFGEGKTPGGYGFRLRSTAARSSRTMMIWFDPNSSQVAVNNVTFRHVEMDWDNGTGTSATNVTRCFDAGLSSNNGTTFTSCYFHHSSGFAIYNNQGANIVVERCYFYRNGGGGGDTAHWELMWNTSITNLTYRYNIMEDTIGTVGQTGWMMIGGCDNVKIYGNVWYGSSAQSAVGGNGVCSTWSNDTWQNNGISIINNTFVDLPPANWAPPKITWFHNSANDTNVVMKNNLFYNQVFDYELIDVATHNAFGGGQASTGTNAQTGITTTKFVNYAGDNFRLASATTAGDNAVGAEYNTDMDGNIRGADGTWDRGAFEFAPTGDLPPTIQSSTISSAGNQITLAFSEAVTVGAGGAGGVSLSMSGGAVTLSGPVGSGASRTYSIVGRVISSEETGTLTYTQPGNGFEDSALQDLVSVAGLPITNNSTIAATAAPVFSPAQGPYFGTQNVTMTSSTPGATIRYTTNGTDPTASSTLYAGPIAISSSTNYRAKAFAPSGSFIDSSITSASYEIGTWVSGAAWKLLSVPQRTGSFTWSFRASASTVNASGHIWLSPVAATVFSDWAVIVRFNGIGAIDAYNGTAYTAANTFTYVAGTTYEFVATVNLTARTFSLTAAQIGGTPVTIASNYAFNSTQASATELDNVGISIPSTGVITLSQMSFGGAASIPTLTSATVGSNGTTLTIGFSEAVTYGTGGSGGWTISASGGAATMTPTANPTTFTVSRPISTGETGTISYVQPGNGVEAVTGGGDLATLTGFAFNNQSTVDLTPPIPNPMTFSTIPIATSSSSVTMTASVANDVSTPPVQYYFDETSGNAGGTDSGWTTSRTYTNNGLSPGIQYTYRVLSRDSAAVPNQTTPSSSVNVTTPIIAGGKVITPAGTTGAGFFNP